MNKQYTHEISGFKEIRKQMIGKLVPIILLSVLVGIGIPFLNSSIPANQINSLRIAISIILFAISFGLLKVLSIQKLAFESYKLTILHNKITREQLNMKTINIPFSEITSIKKDQKGNFLIIGTNALDTIGISYLINDYKQLENSLEQIRPIEPANKASFMIKYQMAFILISIACMAIVYISKNKIFVTVCGIIVIGLLLWSMYQIFKNKNIDTKTKRGSLLILFVLLSTQITH